MAIRTLPVATAVLMIGACAAHPGSAAQSARAAERSSQSHSSAPNGSFRNGPPAANDAHSALPDRVIELLQFVRLGSDTQRIDALDKLAVSGPLIREHAAEIGKYLNAPSADVCRAAARCLWAMSTSGIPEWINASQSRDGYVRRLAVIALSDPRLPSFVGDYQQSVRGALEASIFDPDPLITRPAAEALCENWTFILPKLNEAMKLGKPAVKEVVVSELMKGRAINGGSTEEKLEFAQQVDPDLLRAIASGGVNARKSGLDALLRHPMQGMTPQVVELVKKLADSRAEFRGTPDLGIFATETATGPLIEGAKSTEPLVRALCITSLADRSVSMTDPKVISILTGALLDSYDPTRAAALAWAMKLSHPEPALAPMLAHLVTPGDRHYDAIAENRITALTLLGRIAADAGTVVPVMLRAVDDSNPDVRIAAIVALRQFGPDARPATDRLVKLAREGVGRISNEALETLLVISPEVRAGLAQILVEHLASEKGPSQRIEIIHNLARVGSSAAVATPELEKLLASDDNALRTEVAITLGTIGPQARAALGPLTRMMDNPSAEVRQAAAEALLKIAPDGKGLGPAVMAAVYNGDAARAVRLGAALRRSTDNGAFLRRLGELAADPEPAVRNAAHLASLELSDDSATAPASRPAGG